MVAVEDAEESVAADPAREATAPHVREEISPTVLEKAEDVDSVEDHEENAAADPDPSAEDEAPTTRPAVTAPPGTRLLREMPPSRMSQLERTAASVEFAAEEDLVE